MARGRNLDDDITGRLRDSIAGHAGGVHHPNAPAHVLDNALPLALRVVYQAFDGAELFHETILVRSSTDLRRQATRPDGPAPPEYWRANGPLSWVGEHGGDDLYLDSRGTLLRWEKDTGEWLPEASRFDRWLLGTIEAEALLYDKESEFVDDAFDENGDVSPDTAVAMCRRVLARDKRAPGPRWRLARALSRSGNLAEARDELEQVVAERADFAWAWFDLAQISEALGELTTGLDELCAAAEALPDYEHAGFFYAHAARLAAALEDDGRRAELAAMALERDPDLVRVQRDGARANAEAGDLAAAENLAYLALALAPRDLAVLDLVKQIRSREA